MSKHEEPDWLAELAKGGEATRRQVEPLVQTAVELVQLARLDWPKTGNRPALPLSLRLATVVMNSRPRELKITPTPRYIWAPPPAIEVSIAQPASIVRSGSIALPRMGVTGQLTAEDRPRGLAGLSDGQVVVLVLVWLFAFVLPLLGPELPTELHTVLSDSYATFALALAITWRIRDKSR